MTVAPEVTLVEHSPGIDEYGRLRSAAGLSARIAEAATRGPPAGGETDELHRQKAEHDPAAG
ncbi:MAG: hypothetical protein ABIS85_10230 [Pseudoxanthomonas sp.]